MRLQQQISLARNQRWVGREMEVLVEKRNARNDDRHTDSVDATNNPKSTLIGRSFRDAPEIDGQVYVADPDAQPGDFITSRITDAQMYDLVGIAC